MKYTVTHIEHRTVHGPHRSQETVVSTFTVKADGVHAAASEVVSRGKKGDYMICDGHGVVLAEVRI